MELLLRDRRAILTFIGPALLVYTLVVLVPIVWSLVYTLFEGNVIAGFQFVGLHNFALLVRDPAFWQSVAFTLKYAFFVTIGQVGVGLLLALLYVFYLRNASGLVRTLIFFPVILPTVAVAQMYSKLFEIAPQLGLVNSLLQAVHLDGWVQPWLGQGGTAFIVLVNPVLVSHLQHQWDAQGVRQRSGFDEWRSGTGDDASDIVNVQHGFLQRSVRVWEHHRICARLYVPYRDPGDLQVRTPQRCLEKRGSHESNTDRPTR